MRCGGWGRYSGSVRLEVGCMSLRGGRARAVDSRTLTEGKDRAALLAEISLILAAVFWGTNYAATKYATGFVPPLLIVGIRFTVGGLLMLCLLRILEPGVKPTPKDLLLMAALGCLGVAVGQTAFTFGVSLTSAANTGLIFATAPVWGMMLGLVLGLERPSVRGVAGVVLSILGVAVVFYEGLGSGDASLVGDVLVLVAAAGFGGYTVLSMIVLGRHSPLAVSTYSLLSGGLIVLALSTPYSLALGWGSVGIGAWAAVAFSATFAAAFAFSAWQTGISRIGANKVLIYQYLVTLTGIASGIVFFGEVLGIEKIVGGAIILLGVYLARRQRR
jgi:drug/metabolite transporter (DMT)-like permease